MRAEKAFAGAFGIFLGLSLLKFGNPPIFEKYVETPTNAYEWFLNPWPIACGYGMLVLLCVIGLAAFRWKRIAPRWLIALPLVWWVWQLFAGSLTLDRALSHVTVMHFTACMACFYLGFFALPHGHNHSPFWFGVVLAFGIMLVVGWQQHFGGLEESRRYFFLYVYPQMKDPPPEYIKKISSNRIFSTLFYPNALAGALLLLLPPVLAFIWQLRTWLTVGARAFLVSAVVIGALACLYWSGSKGGWLLMLFLGLVLLMRLPFSPRLKVAVVSAVLLFGLAGFFWKYSGFFQKGATSVGARFDYWRAAVQTVIANPVAGTGPGTFAIPYARIKQPESEMSKLVHNDYLEQASDSGLVGFLAYAGLIIGGLVFGFPKTSIPLNVSEGKKPKTTPPNNNPAAIDWLTFSIWLGVLGWSLQGVLEFGLYIPALAWPAFTLLGWLLGARALQETTDTKRSQQG